MLEIKKDTAVVFLRAQIFSGTLIPYILQLDITGILEHQGMVGYFGNTDHLLLHLEAALLR